MAQNDKPTPGTQLDAAQADAVSGGVCTPEELRTFTEQLKQMYENLVDFTSHVIERVAGPNP
jgi:hypothetical protein